MGALFNASMRLCDDCGRERTDLEWFGQHIRICHECRTARLAAPKKTPQAAGDKSREDPQ